MNKTYLVLVASIIAFLLSACGGSGLTDASQLENETWTLTSYANAGEIINLESCVYKRNDVEYAAECGQLIIPENRERPDSRLVSVPITRVKATGANPA